MTNLLSKRLLCGIIATSFILINCQKAPNRKVKADGGSDQKLGQSAKLVACTKDMVSAIDDRAKNYDDIVKILADKSKIDEAQKEALQNLTNDLHKKSKALFELMRAAKVGTAPADGCTQEDPKGKKDHKIAELDAANRKLAVNVQQVTGKSNDILDNIPSYFDSGKTVVVSADLAAALSDEKSLNGGKMIAEGKVLNGGADYEKLKADRTKTSCIITSIDKAAVAADTKAVVMNVAAARIDDKSKRSVVDMQIAIKTEGAADRPMGLSCNIADGADAREELVKTLVGPLMFFKEPVATPAPTPEEPKPEEPKKEEPKPEEPKPEEPKKEEPKKEEPKPADPKPELTPEKKAEAQAALGILENRLAK